MAEHLSGTYKALGSNSPVVMSSSHEYLAGEREVTTQSPIVGWSLDETLELDKAK